jgi:hypothetical protein
VCGGARPEVHRRVAKSASHAPILTGIAPKQRGGREELTTGLEEVGEVSAEEIGAADPRWAVTLQLGGGSTARERGAGGRRCGLDGSSGRLL